MKFHNRFLLFLLTLNLFGVCHAYKVINRCDELTTFLKAVPNSCVLFYDAYTGTKKNMLRRIEADYRGLNIRSVLVDVSDPAMRACADKMNVVQYPSFALFKKCDLVKIVRGNPVADDLHREINKQLVRDPENWALINSADFFECNWAHRNKQVENALPERCSKTIPSQDTGILQNLLGTIPEGVVPPNASYFPQQGMGQSTVPFGANQQPGATVPGVAGGTMSQPNMPGFSGKTLPGGRPSYPVRTQSSCGCGG